MGNRSSSSPYSPHTLPYGKRPPPAAYIEPYVDFGHRPGYPAPSQGIFMDRRLGGSRLSLNAVPVEAPIIIPDLKTLKKLEKMDKKQRKIMKKLGLTPMPPPPPHFIPPPPRYPSPPRLYNSRALSVDDLQRAQLDRAESRLREQWRRQQQKSVSSVGTSRGRSSLSSSSPVTSSSEAPTVDRIATGSKATQFDGTRTIEVRVQRKEEAETTNYALPIVRGQFGSKSSLGTMQMRTDQSEIDFSWVSEEEEKLRSEGRRMMPECYFGAQGSELRPREPFRSSESNGTTDPCGPSERRLHRLQRQDSHQERPGRWRNSNLAF